MKQYLSWIVAAVAGIGLAVWQSGTLNFTGISNKTNCLPYVL